MVTVKNRDFDVEINIQYKMQSIEVSEILTYVGNRDISVLTLIDDIDYNKGLEKIKSEIHNEPNVKLAYDFVEMFCTAKKL